MRRAVGVEGQKNSSVWTLILEKDVTTKNARTTQHLGVGSHIHTKYA
jgi:hypothetical protein